MFQNTTRTASIAGQGIFSRIKPSTALNGVKTPKGFPIAFDAKTSPYHVVEQNTFADLKNPLSPNHYRVKKGLWENTHPLWLAISTSKAAGGRYKVVRSHMRNRVKAAVVMALKEKGYDIHGKRDDGGFDLIGTLRIWTKSTAMATKLEDIQAHASFVLEKMILEGRKGILRTIKGDFDKKPNRDKKPNKPENMANQRKTSESNDQVFTTRKMGLKSYNPASPNKNNKRATVVRR